MVHYLKIVDVRSTERWSSIVHSAIREVPIPTLRLALGQFDTGWEDPAASLARTRNIAERALRAGARLLALPEMSTTGWTMDRSYAESIRGESVSRLSDIAAETGLYILAGIAVKSQAEDGGRFTNSAILISPGRQVLLEYRKQRLFGLAGEDRSYDAGNASQVADVAGVRIAPFICYDLRFPELFRAVARDTHAIVLIANWPYQRQEHWDALTRARAIENLCYMAAVNRIGEAGGARYDGGSVAYDPWGRRLFRSDSGETVEIVDIDTEVVETTRQKFPFIDDMQEADTVGGGSRH